MNGIGDTGGSGRDFDMKLNMGVEGEDDDDLGVGVMRKFEAIAAIFTASFAPTPNIQNCCCINFYNLFISILY